MNQAAIVSAPKPAPDRAFVIGDASMQRATDPTVAVAVTVNIDVRNGDRAFSATATLHELPLLRRLYGAIGGTARPRTDWVPGIRRRSKLSHLQLQDELDRLSRKYVVAHESGTRDIMSEVYGATGSVRLQSLRDKMRQAAQLWAEIETSAMDKVRASGREYHKLETEAVIAEFLNEKDLEKIVRALDPAEVTADTIELDAIEDVAALEPAGQSGSPAVTDAPAKTGAAMSLEAMFGTEEPGEGAAQADLSDTDLLIASLRQGGLDSTEANQAAIVITTYTGSDRADKLRERGLKTKALAAAIKAGKEYDSATKVATG
jgi:hypothetical protein